MFVVLSVCFVKLEIRRKLPENISIVSLFVKFLVKKKTIGAGEDPKKIPLTWITESALC